ncbi:MAG TPA: tRNA (N6-threonylcarbamoyladenosine(37)-N6)-methyltransferase TrmO [Solirubrobacteraceae bacterium]|jgi:tRNA-Thr(GGU) m(6)t(6)A37 methyltransferase TsaA|nr:tRNA (N6-threonylcarbamoyladenosine(37)-N6)-methyltransferase TrmO [Solirubrobacteraceae bacterium]
MILRPVGHVASPLTDRDAAPKQGDEGAPEAEIVFEPGARDAHADIAPGDELLVLTWLHLAQRDKLRVHPRSDPSRRLTGVFSTRSPDRPNPIGLHRVRVVAVAEDRIRVGELEAVDGTPVVDIKPVIRADGA